MYKSMEQIWRNKNSFEVQWNYYTTYMWKNDMILPQFCTLNKNSHHSIRMSVTYRGRLSVSSCVGCCGLDRIAHGRIGAPIALRSIRGCCSCRRCRRHIGRPWAFLTPATIRWPRRVGPLQIKKEKFLLNYNYQWINCLIYDSFIKLTYLP